MKLTPVFVKELFLSLNKEFNIEFMTALEIKNNLLKLVAETDDTNVLNQVQTYFKSLVKEKDWWEVISDNEKKDIRKGQIQIAEGKGISNEIVKEKVNELLNKH